MIAVLLVWGVGVGCGLALGWWAREWWEQRQWELPPQSVAFCRAAAARVEGHYMDYLSGGYYTLSDAMKGRLKRARRDLARAERLATTAAPVAETGEVWP